MALQLGLPRLRGFEQFYVGDNADLYAHLKKASQFGGLPVIPTYIWGEPGSGKTHLLQAVKTALIECGMGQFGWMDARGCDQPVFQEQWQWVIMDDVHEYSPALQQQAFNWFIDALSPSSGVPRWVLASGELRPVELELRSDLRSRLAWGHVFQLKVLTETDRKKVLIEAARDRGLLLGEEVLHFMLTRFSRDMGSLMDLLDELDLYALQTQRVVTVPMLKAMLNGQ